MKEETKEIIQWIKKQINFAKETWIDPAHKDGYPEYEADYCKAFKFLDSLPEIEARLCRGGYIQDKNGKPCREGDKIIFGLATEMIGTLVWDDRLCKFKIKYYQGGTTMPFYSEIDRTAIEKVD